MKFFTSDNHFFHKNINKLQRDTRGGYNTLEELHKAMADVWNSTVSPEDEVYMLGDFSFAKWCLTESVLEKLNGIKTIILGNHDHWVTKYSYSYFKEITHYKEITIDKKKVVLFHYPIVEWNGMHHGSFHLYGHVHGSYTHPGKALDVGIDNRPQKDLGLWTWEEIVEYMEDRPILGRH